MKFKQILFVVFNLINLLAIIFSLWLYSSLIWWIPWYEPCGLQLLGILKFSLPTFLIVGISMFVLGFFLKMSLFNRFLPFISGTILGLPFILRLDYFFQIWIWCANILGAVLFALAIVTTVGDLTRLNKAKTSAEN
jgi:hypothetical protein